MINAVSVDLLMIHVSWQHQTGVNDRVFYENPA